MFLVHLIQSNKTIGALSNITRAPTCELKEVTKNVLSYATNENYCSESHS
jgi:hypothetical protein